MPVSGPRPRPLIVLDGDGAPQDVPEKCVLAGREAVGVVDDRHRPGQTRIAHLGAGGPLPNSLLGPALDFHALLEVAAGRPVVQKLTGNERR